MDKQYRLYDVSHFFRYASKEEMIEVFYTDDFDVIKSKFSEEEIINKINEYIGD